MFLSSPHNSCEDMPHGHSSRRHFLKGGLVLTGGLVVALLASCDQKTSPPEIKQIGSRTTDLWEAHSSTQEFFHAVEHALATKDDPNQAFQPALSTLARENGPIDILIKSFAGPLEEVTIKVEKDTLEILIGRLSPECQTLIRTTLFPPSTETIQERTLSGEEFVLLLLETLKTQLNDNRSDITNAAGAVILSGDPDIHQSAKDETCIYYRAILELIQRYGNPTEKKGWAGILGNHHDLCEAMGIKPDLDSVFTDDTGAIPTQQQ